MTREIEDLKSANKKLRLELENIEKDLIENNKAVFLIELNKEINWLRGNLTERHKELLREHNYYEGDSNFYEIVLEKEVYLLKEGEDIYPRLYSYSLSDYHNDFDWLEGLYDSGYNCSYSVLEILEYILGNISEINIELL